VVGFCQPRVICKAACDGLLIGSGRGIVVLGATVGELRGLAARELLEREKGFLVLRALTVELLPGLLTFRGFSFVSLAVHSWFLLICRLYWSIFTGRWL